MAIFNLKSQAQKENETTIKNAIAIMLADGQIDPNEMEFLITICQRVGLSEKQLKAILQNPQSIEFTPAKNSNERMQQLIDMVWMMMADGHIDAREMDACITLAAKLGFKASTVGALVQHIVNELDRSRVARQVKVNIDAFL
jgi:tellurite resistance protein